MKRYFCVYLLCVVTLAGARDKPTAGVTVHADLREASRGLLHATMEIPVSPGPVTLLYARWIPGEHGPTGPVTNLVVRRMSAGGRPVAWRRDLENMYALQVDVPAHATELEVEVDYLAPAAGAFGSGPTTSAKLAVLNWYLVTLYPAGAAASEITVAPSVTLPEGWDFGTSLTAVERKGAMATFAPLTLEMFFDQPLIAGAHLQHLDLTPGATPTHVIDVAADSAAALAVPAERVAGLKRMPAEFAAVFGSRGYETYHFLVALSDRMSINGVEHHQASDNRAPERYLADDEVFARAEDLLTHEFFHSWNGKHRRPADLLSPEYQQPMRTDLLWVYEGLTNYYGMVLAARSGLTKGEAIREQLAAIADFLAHQTGRTWRPLQDTADAAQLLYTADTAWSSRRRGVDFYAEGTLIWLEADALIRGESGGKRSLDDFVRAFCGDGGTGAIDPVKVAGARPVVAPYVEADVLAALNRVHPHDWAEFFRERLTSTSAEPPCGGLPRSGWKLVRNETPNKIEEAWLKSLGQTGYANSLGLMLKSEDHSIADVLGDSPADRAGAAPGMKIVGVNGRVYSDDLLAAAVKAAAAGGTLELLVDHAGYLETLRIVGGTTELHPHLERVEGAGDLLAAIVKPRA